MLFLMTYVGNSQSDIYEEKEFSPLWSMAIIEQPMTPLKKSKKSLKMNTVAIFPSVVTGFHAFLFWSDQYHLGASFPCTPYREVQNTITTARLLFCLSQSYAGGVSNRLLNQVLAQWKATLQHSLWTLPLPGQLPRVLSSGNSWHCFSKSRLQLQRFKILSHQYADVLHWFCLDIF